MTIVGSRVTASLLATAVGVGAALAAPGCGSSSDEGTIDLVASKEAAAKGGDAGLSKGALKRGGGFSAREKSPGRK